MMKYVYVICYALVIPSKYVTLSLIVNMNYNERGELMETLMADIIYTPNMLFLSVMVTLL